MLAEWVMRGAGDRDSRELLTALDNLGRQPRRGGADAPHRRLGRHAGPQPHARPWRSTPTSCLRPHLDDEEVEPIRALALQGLQSLEDDPGSKVIYELRQRHFPDPWGRPAPGTPEGVEAATAEDLRAFHRRAYRPNGAILGVAGAIDWPALRDAVGRLFGDWPPAARAGRRRAARPGPAASTSAKETQQTQIALAYPTATVASPDYYPARAAAAILGGYASARLFTEVREKRGLCYSVYAGYESLKDRAAVVCYAGTSADRRRRPWT